MAALDGALAGPRFDSSCMPFELGSCAMAPAGSWDVVIHTCVRDEQHILSEWAVHHLLLGVDRIFIYDDQSSPSVEETLSELSKEMRRQITVFRIDFDYYDAEALRSSPYYVAELVGCPTKQRYFMNHFLLTHKDSATWCMFCDADEFVCLRGFDSLPAYLRQAAADVDRVNVRWVCYGSSYLIEAPGDSLIMDAFLYHSRSYHAQVKTIARLSTVARATDAHFVSAAPTERTLSFGQEDALGTHPIHINHYVKPGVRMLLRRKLTRPEVGRARGELYDARGIFNLMFSGNECAELIDTTSAYAKQVATALGRRRSVPTPFREDSLPFFPEAIVSRGSVYRYNDPKLEVTYDLLREFLDDPKLALAPWSTPELELPADFDVAAYRRYNPDLADMDNLNAVKHYIHWGRSEGRVYSIDVPEDFDVATYKALHSDLAAMDDITAAVHYFQAGRAEGRSYL